MLLGAARLLKEAEERLRRRVRLLFQSAEELLEGAKDCVAAGVLDGVTSGMMLHVLPSMPFPVGTAIVSAEGVSAPAADFFDWTVSGKGCHGSSPWQGVDALLIGAKVVTALESLNSREVSPLTPVTLTLGAFHAGDVANAIAERATISGTIRAMDEKTRSFVKKRMEEIGKTTAKVFRGSAKLAYNGGCPCLKNDGEVSAAVYALAKKTIGKEKVILSSVLPKGGIGGSEDFAYIAEKIPAVMVGICAGSGGQVRGEPLHSPKVCFDEECMPYGVALLAAVPLSR
jgi:hippurate hydrolase